MLEAVGLRAYIYTIFTRNTQKSWYNTTNNNTINKSTNKTREANQSKSNLAKPKPQVQMRHMVRIGTYIQYHCTRIQNTDKYTCLVQYGSIPWYTAVPGTY